MQNTTILYACRTKNNLTQTDMAKIINVSLSNYKLYEVGLLPMNLEQLNTISNKFDLSLDFLLGLSSKPDRNHFRKSIDYRYLKFCINFLRKRDGITQNSLANEFGISSYSIVKYESNPTKIPITYIYMMCQKFHISADYICGKSMKKEVL